MNSTHNNRRQECNCVCVLQVMEEAIQRLEKRHKEHIILYDPSGVSGGERGRGRREYGREVWM